MTKAKTEQKVKTAVDLRAEREKRARLANVRVLVADRDYRTASLLHRILTSFGFRHLDLTTNGESALALLRSRPFDLIITEWNMEPVDGLELVKAIRAAKDDERIRRDIPIVMLTARSEIDKVQAARDAGITEFVVKPFTAKTISHRLIQVIDAPRAFVEAGTYVGPCRRRREAPPPTGDRRGARKPFDRNNRPARIIPPNKELRDLLGGSASDILNETVISDAHAEMMDAEDDYIEWAKGDMLTLESAFTAI
jgi:two-component system chemotaxis response regulator CheY